MNARRAWVVEVFVPHRSRWVEGVAASQAAAARFAEAWHHSRSDLPIVWDGLRGRAGDFTYVIQNVTWWT